MSEIKRILTTPYARRKFRTALSVEDIKSLDCIRTSGAFSLEKSIGMYADVKRLRQKNTK